MRIPKTADFSGVAKKTIRSLGSLSLNSRCFLNVFRPNGSVAHFDTLQYPFSSTFNKCIYLIKVVYLVK